MYHHDITPLADVLRSSSSSSGIDLISTVVYSHSIVPIITTCHLSHHYSLGLFSRSARIVTLHHASPQPQPQPQLLLAKHPLMCYIPLLHQLPQVNKLTRHKAHLVMFYLPHLPSSTIHILLPMNLMISMMTLMKIILSGLFSPKNPRTKKPQLMN